MELNIMKIIVTESMFIDQFASCGRESQFSYQAKKAIFEYMEDMERDTGEDYELDVIAICCEISEESADSIIASYGLDDADMDDDEKSELVRDYLEDQTTLIAEINGSFVYIQF
jgi:hypothetical protein